MFRFLAKALVWGGAFLLGAVLFFFAVYRPMMIKWGTTKEERAREMPGDNLLSEYAFTYIQAITIHAPKEIVWAYLKQVGYRRAGWYNLDWINGLIKDYFYEGGKSADRVIPELQRLTQGDMIYIVPDFGFQVEKLAEAEQLLLVGYEPGKNKTTAPVINTWVYTLEEVDAGTTRVLTRFKTKYPREFGMKLMMAIINEAGGAGLQQPAMLKGLKKRAEAEYKKTMSDRTKATKVVTSGNY